MYYLGDLYRYNTTDNTWEALSPLGLGPSARHMVALAGTPDGSIFAFGGYGISGDYRRGMYRVRAEDYELEQW